MQFMYIILQRLFSKLACNGVEKQRVNASMFNFIEINVELSLPTLEVYSVHMIYKKCSHDRSGSKYEDRISIFGHFVNC